jgi:hypothetical protein
MCYLKQKQIYEEYVQANYNNYKKFVFTNKELLPIIELTKRIVDEKQKEENHRIDNLNTHKRFMTGLIGELAVEKFLNINIIDYSQSHSKFYNQPDIANQRIGIKTVEYGKVPLIPAHNTYSQIICIRETPRTVLVCGLATADVLNEYQDEDLVLAKSLRQLNEQKRASGRQNSIKTGFYGFHKLVDINTIIKGEQ